MGLTKSIELNKKADFSTIVKIRNRVGQENFTGYQDTSSL